MPKKIYIYSDTKVNQLFSSLPQCCHMIKFPHAEYSQCVALNKECACNPDICAFYQTEKDYQDSVNKANERLASLPDDMQIHISDKYFDGKEPWIEKSRHRSQL